MSNDRLIVSELLNTASAAVQLLRELGRAPKGGVADLLDAQVRKGRKALENIRKKQISRAKAADILGIDNKPRERDIDWS